MLPTLNDLKQEHCVTKEVRATCEIPREVDNIPALQTGNRDVLQFYDSPQIQTMKAQLLLVKCKTMCFIFPKINTGQINQTCLLPNMCVPRRGPKHKHTCAHTHTHTHTPYLGEASNIYLRTHETLNIRPEQFLQPCGQISYLQCLIPLHNSDNRPLPRIYGANAES